MKRVAIIKIHLKSTFVVAIPSVWEMNNKIAEKWNHRSKYIMLPNVVIQYEIVNFYNTDVNRKYVFIDKFTDVTVPLVFYSFSFVYVITVNYSRTLFWMQCVCIELRTNKQKEESFFTYSLILYLKYNERKLSESFWNICKINNDLNCIKRFTNGHWAPTKTSIRAV